MLSVELIRAKLDQCFPYPKPRAEQVKALDQLAPWIYKLFTNKFSHLYFGCDAPTGIGKAGLAVTVASAISQLLGDYAAEYKIDSRNSWDEDEEREPSHPYQIWVVTQNKLLQDQYQKDFKDQLFDFRGLDNYKCYMDKGKTCGQSKCGRIYKKGETYPKACTHQCEYDEVKREAKFAPILSLNSAKAFTLLKDPKFPKPTMVVYDEGHGVESALDNEASFSITPKGLDELNLQFETFFHNLLSVEEIFEGLEKLKPHLTSKFKFEKGLPVNSRDPKLIRKLEGRLLKIDEILKGPEQGINYVSCSGEFVDLRPVKVYPLFRKVFKFPTLFLSATLLSQRGFISMTGIKDEELDWFSIGSPFPKENRPIHNFWRFGSRAINFQNMSEELPNLISRVREILDKHPTEKGIIHTHTYKIAESIYNELFPMYGQRLLFPRTAMEQKEILSAHEKSKSTVLISPSMTEGVDLKDALCRFSVLCKVPYLPLNDPIVEARMGEDSEWYSYKTAMTIVQAPGRGVRSMTDHAVTYLIDPSFSGFINRSRHHFPDWFLEAIQKGYRGTV